jgi:hypothetical protein
MTGMVALLAWASAAASILAVVVYFYVIARQPQWVRLLNGSSLFFTGVALSLVAVVLPRAAASGSLGLTATAAGLLILSVVVQAVAALRNRRAWDGVDRRQGGDETEGRAP